PLADRRAHSRDHSPTCSPAYALAGLLTDPLAHVQACVLAHLPTHTVGWLGPGSGRDQRPASHGQLGKSDEGALALAEQLRPSLAGWLADSLADRRADVLHRARTHLPGGVLDDGATDAPTYLHGYRRTESRSHGHTGSLTYGRTGLVSY